MCSIRKTYLHSLSFSPSLSIIHTHTDTHSYQRGQTHTHNSGRSLLAKQQDEPFNRGASCRFGTRKHLFRLLRTRKQPDTQQLKPAGHRLDFVLPNEKCVNHLPGVRSVPLRDFRQTQPLKIIQAKEAERGNCFENRNHLSVKKEKVSFTWQQSTHWKFNQA